MIDAILTGGGRSDGKQVRVDEHAREWLEAEPVVITAADLIADPPVDRPPVMPCSRYRWTGETRAGGTRVFRFVPGLTG